MALRFSLRKQTHDAATQWEAQLHERTLPPKTQGYSLTTLASKLPLSQVLLDVRRGQLRLMQWDM